jgi:hypothetical protein
MIAKQCHLLALLFLLTSCSLATLNTEAVHVKLSVDPIKLNSCEYRGEVIGSAGHWYDFLFISNNVLVQAAINDIRNQAAAKGADTVYIEEPQQFTTSVTMLGLAYRCQNV